MAPRGANPSTTTNATANGTAATDSPARRIFEQLDTNHDGTLSFEEFSRATFQQPAKP
jgi:Ca2+-binding EF-hand superfamily protein